MARANQPEALPNRALDGTEGQFECAVRPERMAGVIADIGVVLRPICRIG
jgi:hypothetical protein